VYSESLQQLDMHASQPCLNALLCMLHSVSPRSTSLMPEKRDVNGLEAQSIISRLFPLLTMLVAI
jgi:hypothetical protein